MYDLKQFKEKFDPALSRYLNERISEFTVGTTDPYIKEIASHAKDLVMAAGKRVRPYIAYVMYCAAGGKEEKKALEFFITLEIFHMFCLVHDDIMDKASLRHGVSTEHEFVNKKLKELKRIGDIEHVGISQAILVGDFLFAWSARIFSHNENFKKESLEVANKIFYKMADEVILGQMIDIDLTSRENPKLELINQKTRLKTSRYSFVRPMQIGASLADADNDFADFCENFGTRIGIAFQTQDDYLDIMGDPKLLNKNILGDVCDHQPTFFTNFVFNHGNDAEKDYLNQVFGKEMNDKERSKVKKIFIESRAIVKGEKLIEENYNQAKEILSKSKLGQEYKSKLTGLIILMETRKN